MSADMDHEALKRHQERCGTEFCALHRAAPDLLAALERWVAAEQQYDTREREAAYHNGIAAIAKAREVKP